MEGFVAVCVAGSLALVAATGALFGIYEHRSAPQFLLTFPEMIWEATFGIYLAAKGFTSPARSQDVVLRRATAPVAALG